MQTQQQIEELKTIVQTLLDEAKQQGASAAEAGLSREDGLSVSARLGEVESIEHHCDQGLGITVFFGKRKGSPVPMIGRQHPSKKPSAPLVALPDTLAKTTMQVCRIKTGWLRHSPICRFITLGQLMPMPLLI